METGLLTYPVALLTVDEIMLAGGSKYINTSYYLYTNHHWWALSPSHFNDSNINRGAHIYSVYYSVVHHLATL